MAKKKKKKLSNLQKPSFMAIFNYDRLEKKVNSTLVFSLSFSSYKVQTNFKFPEDNGMFRLTIMTCFNSAEKLHIPQEMKLTR